MSSPNKLIISKLSELSLLWENTAKNKLTAENQAVKIVTVIRKYSEAQKKMMIVKQSEFSLIGK